MSLRASLLFVLAALAAPAGPDVLTAKLAAIAKPFPGRIGIAVRHLESGKTAGLRVNEPFPTQSVYKLPISLAALRVAKVRHWPLTRPIPVSPADIVPGTGKSAIRDRARTGTAGIGLGDLITAALVDSDNTASDVLLRFAGGAAVVNKNLPGWQIGTTLKAFDPARNTVMPAAAVAMLATIQEDPAHTYVLKTMARCKTGPKRLKGLLPAGTPVAHKTGSGGALATNDVGIVTLPDGTHLAIAAFVKDATTNEAGCERVIAQLARTAWDHHLGASGRR